MNNPLWHDPAAWIAVGVTVGIAVVTWIAALAMHHVFIKIMRAPPPGEQEKSSKNEP
jgi:hypothetical protein